MRSGGEVPNQGLGPQKSARCRGKRKDRGSLQELLCATLITPLFGDGWTMNAGSRAVSFLMVATLLSNLLLTLNLLILTFGVGVNPGSQNSGVDVGEQILEVKIVLVDNSLFPAPTGAIQAVGKFLIDGGVDYNDRQYKFRTDQVVTLTAMDEMYGYKFAFWQKEEPGFSGLIVTNRTLTILMNSDQIWWANYVK